MCYFGMQSKDENGIGLVKKPTMMMTNAPEVASRVGKRCTNHDCQESSKVRACAHEKHRHVSSSTAGPIMHRSIREHFAEQYVRALPHKRKPTRATSS